MFDDQIQSNNNDEILIMDESGEFKVLSNGVLKPHVEVGIQEPGTKNQEHPNNIIQKPPANLPMDTGLEEKMLQPPTPVVYKKNAAFYFHPEDEEEVEQVKQRMAKQRLAGWELDELSKQTAVKPHEIIPQATLKQASAEPAAPRKRYSLDKILIKIINNYHFKLDDNITNRLRLAVYSYLRDRRTLIDTQAILEKTVESGGMGLSLVNSSSLLDFLKQLKEKINVESGLVVDEKEEAQKKSQLYEAPKETYPAKSATAQAVPKEGSAVDKINIEPIKPMAGTVKMQRPVRSAGNVINDVKGLKLSGPVEELGQLDLDTFRRLGNNTAERCLKVIQKVNSLGEASLVKKAAGIKAWRQSPLYKMYVAVGQASMESNLGVETIIKKYNEAGRPILGVEEFEAISDLNRKLRF